MDNTSTALVEIPEWDDLPRVAQLASEYSDRYKEIHGIRPRWSADWTEAQFEAALADLAADEEYERVEEEARITRTIAAGAGDRETAIRWLREAEEAVYEARPTHGRRRHSARSTLHW